MHIAMWEHAVMRNIMYNESNLLGGSKDLHCGLHCGWLSTFQQVAALEWGMEFLVWLPCLFIVRCYRVLGATQLDQLLKLIDAVHLSDDDWTRVLRVMPNKLLKNHPFRPRAPLQAQLSGVDRQGEDSS